MQYRLAAIIFFSALLPAQDVGMGTRTGSGQRFEAPYTLQIETPHVKWAKPLPGGPIRLLAVPTVGEGRTLVELAERLSLDLTTVSIDPDWDVNKWTMAFGKDYGARAEKGDLKLVYSYLEQELTSSKKFDAILLPMHHGWDALTPASREALKRRVQEGCGLVLIRPYRNEMSPLIPTDLRVAESELLDSPDTGKTESSPWQRTTDHYITRAIPVETFPFGDVQNYIYSAAPGATVLIKTDSGHPVLAVQQFGQGRVVAFGYRNNGLSWHMPLQARAHQVEASWEQFYALLVRSIVYAARREPQRPPDFSAASATWRIRDQYNHVRKSGKGKPPSLDDLEPGRYFLEQQAGSEWNITARDIGKPEQIDSLEAEPATIAEGAVVTVRWKGAPSASVELVDGFDRVIARAEGNGAVRLTAGKPLTHSGVVRATAGGTVRQAPVRFVASSREWNDYEVILPWYGPRSYQPWVPAVDEQFRKIGITTLADPDRNFKMMVSAHLPGFGIYWYRRDAYLQRKADFLKTGDKKYLRREVTLESPEFDAGMRAQLDKSLRPLAPLKPMACYLADESSLTFYADAFDVDFAPESLAGLRQWLKTEYGTLEALNTSWGTSFGDWDSVMPMTTAEAQKHGNYAPWADHRAYMEDQFVRAFGRARDLVHEIDPGGRASVSGTQVPTAHNGCNWSRIDQEIDYLQPYSGGSQDAMHYLFRPGLPITGFTGYGLVGEEAEAEQWRRLFYGHSGASIFWHYTLLNPDLTMSAQGSALASAFGKLQSGIARVFMNSTVHEDGVAVHFSMASMRGAWITDGKITAGTGGSEGKTSANFAELQRRRAAWVKQLESDGVQFRFLPTEQIESGALDRYRILILPYSIAITDKEAQAIERFVARGGTVYMDDQTGRMDGRCHLRTGPLWGDQPKGFVPTEPRDVGVSHTFGGAYLVSVRDFGASLLTGVLPAKPAKIRLPETSAIRYDLFRGGLAQTEVEAGPAEPVLLVERQTAIKTLTLDKDLNVTLTDSAGAPVDLSVVRLEVLDPSGRLVRQYSSNLTVRNGRAAFQIPFALNDAPGEWRVRARDVLSGLTTERAVNHASGPKGDTMIRVGLIQMDARPYDKEYNLARAEEGIRRAVALGAEIICTPEVAVQGYPRVSLPAGRSADDARVVEERTRILAAAETIPGPATDRLSRLASELGIWIVAGLDENRGGRLYNSAVLISPRGQIEGKYSKVHLQNWMIASGVNHGDDFPVFDIEIRGKRARIGIQICYDIQHPESTRELALGGAEIVFVPYCTSDFSRPLLVHLFETRALENRVYLARVNFAKPRNSGTSSLIDYEGATVHQLDGAPGVLVENVNLTALRAVREESNPVYGTPNRRPTAYKRLSRAAPSPSGTGLPEHPGASAPSPTAR